MLNHIIAFVQAVIMFLVPTANIPEYTADIEQFNTNYSYVYVSGLGGWGDYNIINGLLPYWGTFGGDLMRYLNARGFSCVAASVSPVESCWDRACELYAQLTGTRTDYGKYHSEQHNHERFGKDFTGKALIDQFDSTNKVNLLGHSFGGATVMQFLDLMADGSEEERAVTPPGEISGLFTGGKADWVYSITTFDSPLNGTTAYYIKDEILSDPNATFEEMLIALTVGTLTNPIPDGRDPLDNAGYDMEIDRAMSLCSQWETQENVYYFSFPCDGTFVDEDGTRSFERKDIEYVMWGSMGRIMRWTGTTPSGYVLDESWQANDGLVNTKSAVAPFNAPRTEYDPDNIQPGIWNVMPTQYGDSF